MGELFLVLRPRLCGVAPLAADTLIVQFRAAFGTAAISQLEDKLGTRADSSHGEIFPLILLGLGLSAGCETIQCSGCPPVEQAGRS
jgi:hypothetical protein